MMLLGAEIKGLHLDITGLCMEYRGDLSCAGEMIAALSGPAAGIIYAYALSLCGLKTDSRFLLCSAGVSLALSAFNMLPILPLDGGRCLYAAIEALLGRKKAERILAVCGAVLSLLMTAAGIVVLIRTGMPVMLIAGAALAASNMMRYL